VFLFYPKRHLHHHAHVPPAPRAPNPARPDHSANHPAGDKRPDRPRRPRLFLTSGGSLDLFSQLRLWLRYWDDIETLVVDLARQRHPHRRPHLHPLTFALRSLTRTRPDRRHVWTPDHFA